MTFEELAGSMGDLITDFKTGSDRLMRSVVSSVGDNIILNTPVDTGKARSNWQARAESPMTGTISPFSPGKHLGRGETKNAAGAMLSNHERMAKAKNIKMAFLTNNLDYINHLNTAAGATKQTSPRFIERGILKGLADISAEEVI